MRWNLDDLVSIGDIATRCKASRSTVSNWQVRYRDFPQPLAHVSNGHIALFSWKAVADWYDRKDWKHEGPGKRSSR